MVQRDIREELKNAEKVPGLREHLDKVSKYQGYDWSLKGSAQLSDLTVNVEGRMAAYIVEEHEWDTSRHSGIQMAAIVGVFRNGNNASRKFVYRDMQNPDKDDWSLAFNTIENIVYNDQSMVVRVKSRERLQPLQFDF